MNPNLKLDIFPHIFPRHFRADEATRSNSPTLGAQIKRWLHIPVLWGPLPPRLRMMESFPGYKQRLSLPAIEFLAPHDKSLGSRASRTTARRRSSPGSPDHFPAFVASLPMNNVRRRCAKWTARSASSRKGHPDLHDVNGRTLDEPEFYRSSSAWRQVRPADLGAPDAHKVCAQTGAQWRKSKFAQYESRRNRSY